jgi:hypothetical protein
LALKAKQYSGLAPGTISEFSLSDGAACGMGNYPENTYSQSSFSASTLQWGQIFSIP